MAYDANSPDAEMIMQGMRGLKDIPPLLYLDAGSRCLCRWNRAIAASAL